MPAVINDTVKKLFAHQDTIKSLATVDREGEPNVEFIYDDSIQLNEKGQIVYLEKIETSQTNKNLVYSIWFKHYVTINVIANDRTNYRIKGIPVKAIISGNEFERYYLKAIAEDPNVDLSTVWLIEPEEFSEDTFEIRRAREYEAHPLLLHLDRFSKYDD